MQESGSKNRSTYPAYLYRKGHLLYYRYRIPKAVSAEFKGREIRLSLKTGYVKEAKERASQLHSSVLSFFEEMPMSPEPDFDASKFSELRRIAQQKLAEILNGKDKQLISNAEFRQRMKEDLRKELEEDDRADELISCTRTDPDGNVIEDTANVYANISKEIGRKTSSKEDFEGWFTTAICDMLAKKIIQPEEISNENARVLATVYQQFQSIFYKIKSARMQGDFIFEQQFLNDIAALPTQSTSYLTNK